MNASNQSLGTIKCGELPKLRKNGLKFLPPLLEEMPELKKDIYTNAGNILKRVLHLLLHVPLGGANCGVNRMPGFYLMRSHMHNY